MSAAPGSGGSPPAGRLALAVLVVLFVGALVADRLIVARATPGPTRVVPAMPAMATAGALSSTWFCPALQASPSSDARGRIIIGNPGPGIVSGTVTVTPSAGRVVIVHPLVQPYTRVTYKLEEIAPGPYAAATVSLDGPAGAVEQEIQGPLGQSIAPCASASSDRWYFASGRTDQNASELLSLYNPYPKDAIVDLSFATDQGPATPDAFQGIVVPGGGFNVVDVGLRVRTRAAVASTVTVRSGRLVVDKIQLQSGPAPAFAHGLSLVLGAPAPGSVWYYADGVSGKGLAESFQIYNPGTVEARVQLGARLEQGSADPFDLTVPPGATVSLAVDQEQRIPPGIGQAWILTSTNGAPVVAERIIDSRPPAAHTGIGDTTGSPSPAPGWVFPAGSATSGGDEWVVVFNPGSRPAHVTLTASGSGEPKVLAGGPAGFVLDPGARRAMEINTEFAKGIVVLDVVADVPVVAERAQFNVGAPGLSDSVGIARSPGKP